MFYFTCSYLYTYGRNPYEKQTLHKYIHKYYKACRYRQERNNTIWASAQGGIPKKQRKCHYSLTFHYSKPLLKPATCEECSDNANIVLFSKFVHADQTSTGAPINICWRIFSSCSTREPQEKQEKCTKPHGICCTLFCVFKCYTTHNIL